jgi:hypothetical protein
LMAKNLLWLSLRVLLLTLCLVEEDDELLLPAPATIAGTSREADDHFRSDEFGSVGSEDINTQHQLPVSLESQRRDAAWLSSGTLISGLIQLQHNQIQIS